MSHNYGIALGWSTVGAPKPFSCILDNYEYNETNQEHLEDDEAVDIAAVILHGRTGAITFGGKITDASTDLPDLSQGALIDITSTETATGIVLCSQLVEEWVIGSPKNFSGSASHFPDAVAGDGDAAGALDAYTPTGQTAPIIRPTSKVIWGTSGLSIAWGTVQRLRIEQSLTLSAEPNEAGKLTAITAHRYIRRIQLDVLALASQSKPATDTLLTVAGAPDHAGGAVIKDAAVKWSKGARRMFTVSALWAPGMVDPEPED